ncbi:unnamed protein product [Rotaria sp. Silwood1]|nr:unnamed protein product [Rotaria sp. Silwood1]
MSTIRVRCLLQQCTKATLRLQDELEVTLDDVDQLAKDSATVKLCESDDGLKTIVDLPGDLLIIPQATLGGRLNARRFQYHNNINKDIGLEYYDKLVSNLRELCSQNKDNVVHAGSYGIRQIYSCVTNGPAMHIIEY